MSVPSPGPGGPGWHCAKAECGLALRTPWPGCGDVNSKASVSGPERPALPAPAAPLLLSPRRLTVLSPR